MELNDQIDLYAVFKKGEIIPVAFQWKGRKYLIDTVHLKYDKKEGIHKTQFFSLSSNNTYYKISINGRDNICRLHEVEP